MDATAAEVLAISVLGFLASDAERMDRFLALSGTGISDLKEYSGDPVFLGGVLDHLLSDESLLLMFAESQGIGADEPAKARLQLPGAPVDH